MRSSMKYWTVISRLTMKMHEKFRFAEKGLKILLKDHSVRLQLCISLAAMAVSFLFGFEPYEIAVVFVFCVMVVTAEAFNSVIEYMAEQIDPSKDQAIGRIKDMTAGVVLITSIGALIAGIAILLKHII